MNTQDLTIKDFTVELTEEEIFALVESLLEQIES